MQAQHDLAWAPHVVALLDDDDLRALLVRLRDGVLLRRPRGVGLLLLVVLAYLVTRWRLTLP